jgi:hypothetical protein
MKITALPIEVFFRIGNILAWERYRPCETDNSIELEMLREAKWSWQNFLSVGNSVAWKIIRKTVMIWSLNSYESKKYLEDESFFSYINSRTANLHQQLRSRTANLHQQLRLCLRGPSSLYTLVVERLSFLHVGEINIFNYTGDIFPSSRSLHTLQLRGCDKLTTLGDYENLEVLEMNSCPRLASIGRVDGLSVLILVWNLSLCCHFLWKS